MHYHWLYLEKDGILPWSEEADESFADQKKYIIRYAAKLEPGVLEWGRRGCCKAEKGLCCLEESGSEVSGILSHSLHAEWLEIRDWFRQIAQALLSLASTDWRTRTRPDPDGFLDSWWKRQASMGRDSRNSSCKAKFEIAICLMVRGQHLLVTTLRFRAVPHVKMSNLNLGLKA